MNMKMVVVLMLGAVVFGGVWFAFGKKTQQSRINNESGTKNSENLRIEFTEDGVIVDVGTKKVSMVDIKFAVGDPAPNAFRVNKEVFNTEMLNSVEDGNGWRLVLGVMKSTADLPSGKVNLGKFEGSDYRNIKVAEGKVTVAGDGSSQATELEVASEAESQ